MKRLSKAALQAALTYDGAWLRRRMHKAALQAALTHSQKQVADLTEKYN